jgi:hypothetical protein
MRRVSAISASKRGDVAADAHGVGDDIVLVAQRRAHGVFAVQRAVLASVDEAASPTSPAASAAHSLP